MKKGCSPFRGDSFLDWLMERVEIVECGYETPCWQWALSLTAKGYARWRYPKQFGYGNRTVAVHRVAYEKLVGPIPSGLVIDHLCRNRACQNPKHLEPVTSAENAARGLGNQLAGATECKRGHPFTADNTLIRADGRRRCLTCQRIKGRERRQRLSRERNVKCANCSALLSPYATSGYCASCVNVRLSACERETLNGLVVQLPIHGRVA